MVKDESFNEFAGGDIVAVYLERSGLSSVGSEVLLNTIEKSLSVNNVV